MVIDERELQTKLEQIDISNGGSIKAKVDSWVAGLKQLVDNFSYFKECEGKPIIFITSGGTSVPLEKNTVRSVENFSTGIRGSRSAEYFLKNGYPVIFFHRLTSAKPFEIELSQIDQWARQFSFASPNTDFNNQVRLW